MEDESLKNLLSEHHDLFKNLSRMLNVEDERLPRDTHQGLLNEEMNRSGIEISRQRRKFLQAMAVALAQLSPAGKIGMALSTAGTLGGLVSAYDVIDGWAEKRKDEWEVAPALASKLSRISYNDTRIDNLIDERAARNRGELALLQSYILHRDRRFELLKRNVDDLRHAFDATIDPNARALIVGRMAIDNNAMGLGQDAIESLDLLDLTEVTNPNTLIKCLDYGVSIRLNSLTSGEFKKFEVPELEKLASDWALVGVDLNGTDGIEKIADKYGLHALTVILLRKVKKIAKCSDGSRIRAIRNEWVEETLELAELRSSSAASVAFAEDAFYSLHRPAFHAFVTNDHDGARAICDYYFGRSKRSEGAHMALARQKILTQIGPGTQWMYLLDAARLSKEGNIAEARRQLDTLSCNSNLQLNYIILKTAPYVYKLCGSRIPININIINRKRSRLPEVSLMKHYAEAVTS